MSEAASHLDYVADNLAHSASLSSFAGRISVTRAGSDIVVGLSGRNMRIRAGQSTLIVGNDEVALGQDPASTLGRLAPVLARRLGQMDG